MHELHFSFIITDRSYGEAFIEFLRERGFALVMCLRGRGTATEGILDYLGLENTEKSILFSVLPTHVMQRFMRGIVKHMRIDAPGRGIAFSIPVSSVGRMTMQYLSETHETTNKQSEAATMEESMYELIIATADSGYTDLVMDSARAAGARGGTILHAKSIGSEQMGKFFGISIAEEKELVLIVVKKDIKNEVMKSIMKNAGLRTEAHALVLSLPISAVAGLHAEEEEENSI